MASHGKAWGDDGLPPCMIWVDKEGVWFHNGVPITHRGFLRMFYQSLRLDGYGGYVIKFQDQVCRLDVEDTPFVVLRTDFFPACREGEQDRVILHLIDETQEPLDPSTLSVGDDHVLYCRIRKGAFRARFSRPSYYQLARHIQQDSESGRYFIPVNGKRYFIETLPTGSLSPEG